MNKFYRHFLTLWFYKRLVNRFVSIGVLLILLSAMVNNTFGQTTTACIVNHDFNGAAADYTCSGATYTFANRSAVSGITSVITGSNSCGRTTTGVAPGASAFVSDLGGTNGYLRIERNEAAPRMWQFSITNNSIYRENYKLYLQATRSHTDADNLITIAYSVAGGAFTDFGTTLSLTSAVGTWQQVVFDLSAITALNCESDVRFQVKVSGGTAGSFSRYIHMDNFQVQASSTAITTPNAGPDQDLCSGVTTATLAGNNPSVGTGAWTVIAGGASVTTPSAFNSGVTGLTAGVNTFRWTVSDCYNLTDDINILVGVDAVTVDAVSTATSGGTNTNSLTWSHTVSGTNRLLAVTCASDGTGTVTSVTYNGTALTKIDAITALSSDETRSEIWYLLNPPIGTYNIVWTHNSTFGEGLVGCGVSFNQVDQTSPITAAVKSNTLGAGSSLNVTTTAGDMVIDVISNDDVVVAVAGGQTSRYNPANPAANGIVAGATSTKPATGTTTNMAWTFASENNAHVAVGIKANSSPCGIGGVASMNPSGATLCLSSGNTVDLSLVAYYGTIQWQQNVNGGGWANIPGATSASYTTAALTGGNTYQFRARVTNGCSCSANSNELSVTVYATPTTANAGPDQGPLCNTVTTATLAGNNPAIGTGAWTLVSGSGTVTTPSAYNSGVTGLAPGINTFRWTISNTGCTGTSDDVNIVVEKDAVTVDAVSSFTSGSVSIYSKKWSHTVSGTNRLLIVTCGSEGTGTVTSVKYNGIALTRVDAITALFSDETRAEIWYLLAPPTGTHDIEWIHDAGTGKGLVGCAISFNGVSQTSPLSAAVKSNVNAASAPLTVTTSSGDMVVDIITNETQSVTAAAGQTVRYNPANPAATGIDAAGTSTKPASSSGTTTVVDWTFTSSKNAHVAVAVKANAVSCAVGGTAAICMASSTTATLTLTDYRGTALQWQQSINGGAYADITGATTTPYTTAALTAGNTYAFRAKMTDGCNCNGFSSIVSVIVGPGATNYTFTSPNVSLSSPTSSCIADYTFTQTLPNTDAQIMSGSTVTVNLCAGSDATTMTSGTFNGVAINMATVTKTATQVTFTAPTSTCSTSGTFTIVFNDITNPHADGSCTATVSAPNYTTGTSSASYPYQIAEPASFSTYTGSTSYAVLNPEGKCYNNLVAGKLYCFSYIYPSNGGTFTVAAVFTCGDCGSQVMSTSANNAGCHEFETGGVRICLRDYSFGLYRNSTCSLINDDWQAGLGCMVPGETYTACFLIPSDCNNMSICPQINCQNDAACADGTLPIELISFKAILNNGVVKLNWVTETEINNDYFTIERTTDGVNFEFIAKVKGAGNSSSVLSYNTVDDKPLEGTSYYRLKQTDFDGKFTYSKLVSVETLSDNPLKLNYVVPDQDKMDLRYQFSYSGDKSITIEITDLVGKTVRSENIGYDKNGQTLNVNIADLSKGMYIFKISDGMHVEFKKFVY